MAMLILETFLLMFGSALLGWALGRLLAEAFADDVARWSGGDPAEPWLSDLAPLAAIPVLPPRPELLSEAERARLAEPPRRADPAVPRPAAPIAAADAARAAEADAHGTRPPGLAGPRAGTADDLKQIKGIGRQNEARLNALGVWHFDQIAAWTPENIRWVGAFLAFAGRIDREDWVGQAEGLAAGGAGASASRLDAGEGPTRSA